MEQKQYIESEISYCPCEACKKATTCKIECEHFKLFANTMNPEKRKQQLIQFMNGLNCTG